jgi:hypothetical protein
MSWPQDWQNFKFAAVVLIVLILAGMVTKSAEICDIAATDS